VDSRIRESMKAEAAKKSAEELVEIRGRLDRIENKLEMILQYVKAGAPAKANMRS
jgi:tetrahydromethanopterin S-methyltransferase subunit G